MYKSNKNKDQEGTKPKIDGSMQKNGRIDINTNCNDLPFNDIIDKPLAVEFLDFRPTGSVTSSFVKELFTECPNLRHITWKGNIKGNIPYLKAPQFVLNALNTLSVDTITDVSDNAPDWDYANTVFKNQLNLLRIIHTPNLQKLSLSLIAFPAAATRYKMNNAIFNFFFSNPSIKSFAVRVQRSLQLKGWADDNNNLFYSDPNLREYPDTIMTTTIFKQLSIQRFRLSLGNIPLDPAMGGHPIFHDWLQFIQRIQNLTYLYVSQFHGMDWNACKYIFIRNTLVTLILKLGRIKNVSFSILKQIPTLKTLVLANVIDFEQISEFIFEFNVDQHEEKDFPQLETLVIIDYKVLGLDIFPKIKNLKHLVYVFNNQNYENGPMYYPLRQYIELVKLIEMGSLQFLAINMDSINKNDGSSQSRLARFNNYEEEWAKARQIHDTGTVKFLKVGVWDEEVDILGKEIQHYTGPVDFDIEELL